MAALTSKRSVRAVRFRTVELPAKQEQVYQGGIACFDRSTGLIAKAFASPNLVPVGRYVEDKLIPSGGTVLIELFREVEAYWYANAGGGDAVAQANCGGLVYLRDDQTVGVDDDTNTLSVAGMAWKVDPTKGVLVEFRGVDSRLGGLDA